MFQVILKITCLNLIVVLDTYCVPSFHFEYRDCSQRFKWHDMERKTLGYTRVLRTILRVSGFDYQFMFAALDILQAYGMKLLEKMD